MKTFPLIFLISAIWVLFAITLFEAFGYTTVFIALSALSLAGIIVSTNSYKYFGWPYADKGTYVDIDALTLLRMMEERKDLRILDVRTRHEYRRGHIPGATNRPLSEIHSQTMLMEPTVFVCSTGHRSRMAIRRVSGQEIYNLQGGFRRWSASKLPVERTEYHNR